MIQLMGLCQWSVRTKERVNKGKANARPDSLQVPVESLPLKICLSTLSQRLLISLVYSRDFNVDFLE